MDKKGVGKFSDADLVRIKKVVEAVSDKSKQKEAYDAELNKETERYLEW